MKTFFSFLLVVCMAVPSLAQKDAAYWNKMANGMSQALIKNFWGANFEGYADRYYFNYGSNLSNMTTNHYWPQAHAMDVLVDAYMRTGDKQYEALFPLWWEGAPRFNFAGKMNPKDPWWNVFVDDMEWIVLAQIRMFEATGDAQYIAKARQMYDDWIWPTWGPEDEAPWFGGITWKTDVEKSKNACSNGPAALIAARLYRFYDAAKFVDGKVKEAYLNEAIKIYTWEKNNLFDRQTGAVYDNMNGKGEIQKEWIFTYNVGTFLGAAHELYKITGDKQYLADAVLASNYVIGSLSKDGILSDAPSGDGGLFHGIFFRYFVKLVNEKALDYDTRKKFHDYLTNLATVMAGQGVNPKTMLYAGYWRKVPADDDPVGLTPHLTGCMLMEAMCVLEPLR
ncbi:MAG: glycoside hydrolase family 76 protein [Bacteroidales bacterium]|nr:glycoside hydrolase family 76 protein [Bacteroidales bacterium]